MIRINLSGVERKPARRAPAFSLPDRMTVACVVILAGSLAGIGWWYQTLERQSAIVDEEMAGAQNEIRQLQSILLDVRRFETQRGALQQRVGIIEELRGGQSVPVRLLDHVSRSVPELLWLTQLTQEGTEVTIEGRSTTLIALSDFVGNLGNSELLQKPIEIVNSHVESARGTGAEESGLEVIAFTVKAQMAPAAPTAPIAQPPAVASVQAAAAR